VGLIDNEISNGKISVVSNQIDGKKERSRKIDKTVEINDADILSNIVRKISHVLTINHFKNVGMVITGAKASEDRNTCSNTTFTNTTE
jgi:hypothetical protein